MVVYSNPATSEPIDQGDLIDGCPILEVTAFNIERSDRPGWIGFGGDWIGRGVQAALLGRMMGAE